MNDAISRAVNTPQWHSVHELPETMLIRERGELRVTVVIENDC